MWVTIILLKFRILSFSNIITNLNIAEYPNCEPLANNISDLVSKCVLKYRKHPSYTIGEVCNKHSRLPFSFSKMKRKEILREILKLETSKACQDTDIPTKFFKENADIFGDILFASLNDSVEKSDFPSSLKMQIQQLYLKKVTGILGITTHQSTYFQICLKYLSDIFFVNSTVSCLHSCQNTSVVFAKVSLCSIAC